MEYINNLTPIVHYWSGKTHCTEKLYRGKPVTLFNITRSHIVVNLHQKTTNIGKIDIYIDEITDMLINHKFFIQFNSKSQFPTTSKSKESAIYLSINTLSLTQIQRSFELPIRLESTLHLFKRSDISISLEKVDQLIDINFQSNLMMKTIPIFIPNFAQKETDIHIIQHNKFQSNKMYKVKETIPIEELFNYELLAIPTTPNQTIVMDGILSSIDWEKCTIKERKKSYQVLDFDDKQRLIYRHEDQFPAYFIRISKKKEYIKLWLTDQSNWDWVLLNAVGMEMEYDIKLYGIPIEKKIITKFNQFVFSTAFELKIHFDALKRNKITFNLFELEPFHKSFTSIKSIFPLF